MAHATMSERVRDVGDGLILAFPIADTEVAGATVETVRLYFLRIGAETRYFQKYTALANIAAGNTTPTTGYGYLGDTGVDTGDDIFRIETDDWHLMHFGVGTSHPDLEVFYAVSPRANGDPAQDRTGTGEDITPGTDDRGWISEVHIPDRYDPPAFTERVAFRNDDSGEFLQWAFHNDGGAQLAGNELDLYLTGRGYKTQPVTDPETQDLMLQMALSRPADPVLDTIIHSVGGITQYTLGTEEPDEWKTVRQQDPGMSRTFTIDEFPPRPPGSPPDRGRQRAATPR